MAETPKIEKDPLQFFFATNPDESVEIKDVAHAGFLVAFWLTLNPLKPLNLIEAAQLYRKMRKEHWHEIEHARIERNKKAEADAKTLEIEVWKLIFAEFQPVEYSYDEKFGKTTLKELLKDQLMLTWAHIPHPLHDKKVTLKYLTLELKDGIPIDYPATKEESKTTTYLLAGATESDLERLTEKPHKERVYIHLRRK